MSYQAVEAVMKYSRAVGSERLLLMVIATHADAETMTAYLGETTLCKEANMKERNLRYTLAKLKASGELQCVVGGGRGRANLYSINLSERSDKRGQSTAPLSDEKGQPAARFVEAKRGNPPSEKGQSVAEKGQPIAPQPEEPQRTGEVAEPRPPDPRGFPFDHPAVELFAEYMEPDPELSIKLAERIAAEVKDLTTWREVLVVFSANGYRGQDNTGRNVGNVIHRYWKECQRKQQEAANDDKRNRPQAHGVGRGGGGRGGTYSDRNEAALAEVFGAGDERRAAR